MADGGRMYDEEEAEVKIRIHAERMVLGDLEIMERVREEASWTELLDLLERVSTVEGVESVRQIPLSDLSSIVSDMRKSIDELANPGN